MTGVLNAKLSGVICLSLLVGTFHFFSVPGTSNALTGVEEERYCINTVRSQLTRSVIDDFGVPITEYGYVAGVYIGPQRNPVTVAQQGLGSYEIYTDNNASDALFSFLSNANWLASHAQNYGNFSVFEYRFPLHFPPTTIQPIWRSAMAQGLAVEVLSKAYNITQNDTYIESAKNLLNAFYVDAKDGGVTHMSNGKGWWYELVANNQGIQPRILNGHLFALLGIYDYYNITGDSASKYLFDKGVEALKNNLHRYDYENGTYSYYDLSSPRKMPSSSYHKLVVGQLQELFDITHDPVIQKYLEKWRNFELPAKQYQSETCRRTPVPPVPVFKPVDYGFRIGPVNITNGIDKPLQYQIDIPDPEKGLNFTSQILNYPALNVTVLPNTSKEITFTLNIEEIHRPNVQIQVIFGPASSDGGWTNESLYAINAGSNNSVTVRPSDIVGEEYLRIRSINVFLPQIPSIENSNFGVEIK